MLLSFPLFLCIQVSYLAAFIFFLFPHCFWTTQLWWSLMRFSHISLLDVHWNSQVCWFIVSPNLGNVGHYVFFQYFFCSGPSFGDFNCRYIRPDEVIPQFPDAVFIFKFFLQVTLGQHKFEWHRSTYIWIFF